MIDLAERRFGKLIVVSRALGRKSRWNCVCDCGKTAVVTSANLKNGHTSSCGCLRSRAADAVRLQPFEALHNALVRRCKKIGREVMSFEDFLTFTKIKNCHYCADQIVWAEYLDHKKGYGCNLDRKYSDIGYTKENCVVCCALCNHMKWDMDYNRFCCRIAERIERGEL